MYQSHGGALPQMDTRCPQNPSVLPSLAGREEEIQQKAHGGRKGQGEITDQLPTQAGNWYIAIKTVY